MGFKCNESSSETNKQWTRTAVDCYKLGCICSKCTLYEVFFSKKKFKCKMKETVIELVRKLGVPKDMKNDI